MVQIGLGQQLLGQLPKPALVARHGQVLAECQHTGEHAPHVGVQDGRALAKAERGNCPGRRAADAGQRRQQFHGLRKRAAKVAHHLLRAAVQIARAAVITQAAPQRQHIILRRGGQRLHVRKALQKPCVVIQHRGDLRLLQHDLRQPYAIGVARVLPRQMITAMLFLPAHHARGNIRVTN
ncbi:hypothetical protein SDC9_188260 [bioreactor metagenome]|uniref:Uncharacterized protein n=1 Tax=bioreactor metagenome TaxID=1076179 RepID=A0A645HNV1_9ZZZZ